MLAYLLRLTHRQAHAKIESLFRPATAVCEVMKTRGAAKEQR
jgi:hypothetical protein